MLQAKDRDSFRAYSRGYRSANRYWDAPDGLRYWRGRYEIDRGQPDDAGLRRVDEGGRAIDGWDGPPYAPNAIGLYEAEHILGRAQPRDAMPTIRRAHPGTLMQVRRCDEWR